MERKKHYITGLLFRVYNKRLIKKPEGAIKKGNPEKLATLGTQDTGQRQTKQKNTTLKTEIRA